MFSQWENKHGNLPQGGFNGWAIDAYDSLTAVISINQISDTSVYITTDGGKSWSGIFFERNVSDISITDPDHIWICTGEASIWFTSNRGITWNLQFNDSLHHLTEFLNYIKMFNNSEGIAMGDAPFGTLLPAVFLKTSNGGINWMNINDTLRGMYSSDLWRKVDFINTDTGFFAPTQYNGTDKDLYKTTNGGKTWKIAGEMNSATLIKFYNSNTGFVYIKYCNPLNQINYLLRTNDGGNNWDSVCFMNTSWANDIEYVSDNPSKVWFTNSDTLFFSSDTGKTWLADPVSLEFSNGRDLVIVDKKVCWFLCETVYRNLNADHIISVNENVQFNDGYSLFQNYPNPFNSSTTITYIIPKQNMVVLKIYDILGCEVQTIISEIQGKGKYEKDFSGSLLASGVYFYRLITDDFSVTKKLLILK